LLETYEIKKVEKMRREDFNEIFQIIMKSVAFCFYYFDVYKVFRKKNSSRISSLETDLLLVFYNMTL